MAEKDKRGFFEKLFAGKNKHDRLAPEEGQHRRPDETPSSTVPDGGAPSLQPGTSREPHMATVEEDSEAGGGQEFLNQKEGFGDGDANVEGDEEKPASTEPSAPAAGEPAPDLGAGGEPVDHRLGLAAADALPEPDPVPAEPVAEAPTESAALALSEEAAPETLVGPVTPVPEADADIAPAVSVADEPDPEPGPAPKKRGLFGRLSSGMAKTSGKLTAGLGDVFVQKRELTEEALEVLEDALIGADLGLPATERIMAEMRRTQYRTDVTLDQVRTVVADEVAATLKDLQRPLVIDPANKPHVILVAGVNGAGKTTTIGKLAAKLRAEGRSVLLAAGDTFRAAAIEQLQVWGERTGAPVVTRPQGADAAGLAYDAVEQARRDGVDVVLIDTAGRLQNRAELMDELAKVVRVIRKVDPTAPHDSLLVLDATVGQNALAQAEAFLETAGTTGLVMTKLDGTARGGVLVALGERFGLPIHYVGVGEAVEDLQVFDADAFASALSSAGTKTPEAA